MTYELPRVTLSEEKIAKTVEMGKRQTLSFTVSNDAEAYMKGLVYSSNPQVIVAVPQFVGSENVIEFTVNAEYASVGDVIKGELQLVTNCGEMVLPYAFKVIAPILNSIKGAVKNMNEFASLARSDWSEARRLFASRDFEEFLKYHAPAERFLRERLLKSPSADIAMEEFFVATRRKVGVSLDVFDSEKEYDVGFSSFSDSVRIVKNNWGYLTLSIACDSSFVEVEQEVIHFEDFVASEFELHYVIYPERMKTGINTATITVSGCGITKSITLICRLPVADRAEAELRRDHNKLKIKALDNYLGYMMQGIPGGRYVSEATGILNHYENLEDADLLLAKLYRVELLSISGKESPAVSLLATITGDEIADASPLAKAYRLYLVAKFNPDEKNASLEGLYTLADDYPDLYEIRFFAYLLEDRYVKNIKMGMDELKAIYEKGCNSPVLYMFAAKTLNDEPRLLRELDDFEVRTVLYAVKNNFCSRDVAGYFTNLVLRSKNYVKVYYNILEAIYERFQLKDALTAICQTLIKGFRKDSSCFKWYQKGVEENVRISDLYEYYMYSLDRDIEDDLDQNVLMYYVYNSKLNDRKLALLYANIVLHKDSNPIVYENYKDKMHLFAVGQMREGKNNKVLAILYNDYLSDEDGPEKLSEYLYKVVFRCDLTCNNPLMRYVCVAHKELEEEVTVPLINGSAQIDLFTNDARIFFLDAAGNRYVPGEDTVIEKLMPDDSLKYLAYKSGRDKNSLILSLAEKARDMRKYDATSIELRKQVVAMPGVTADVRAGYLAELALYFYDHAQDEISDDDLKKLDYRLLNEARRAKFISLLILREQNTLAYKLLNECGYKNIDIKLLEKFVVALPPVVLGNYDKFLCELMYYLFMGGRRHEKILIYLVSFYNGLTSAMYDIWHESMAAKCTTSDYDERLLSQILFTESYLSYGEEIYAHYNRRAKNRVLTKAYFNYLSYKYLTANVPITPASIESMKKDAYFESNDIVLLALLKQYSQAGELTKEEQEFAKGWLEILNARGKILPCFKRFSRYFRLPEDMEDKVYIEYRSNPGHRITIHLSSRKDGRRTVDEEPMRNICYGIFVKEFVLFAGESVEYVIDDDDGRNMVRTEKNVITGANDTMLSGKNRFSRINAITRAKELGDKARAVELLNEYVKNEFAISQLFREL